jgi:hypothetical protein
MPKTRAAKVPFANGGRRRRYEFGLKERSWPYAAAPHYDFAATYR